MITDSECESVASKESTEPANLSELEFLKLQNRRLSEELNIYKNKVKSLQSENHELKASKCAMQAKVEVEEEFITNSLLRQIENLKSKIENVNTKYDCEEACIVSDLTNKLQKLESDKNRLEALVNQSNIDTFEKLNKKVKKLEEVTRLKQKQLEQLRNDKGELQNALENEQEALLNRLWRNISKAESDRILISEKMDVHDFFRDGNNSLPLQRQSFSLEPSELYKMSINELTQYVADLQKELASLQTRTYSLKPEIYQKFLKDCNISDEKHWIRQKIPLDMDDSTFFFNRPKRSFDKDDEVFKRPNDKSSPRIS